MIIPVIIEIDGQFCGAWETKRHGQANEANLEEFVKRYVKSFEAGGVNFGTSKSLGYIPYPREARIVRQRSSRVLAKWKAAPFQVW